jgi:dTDP-4-amino-4,6-dideoxy-D-galactose acyltransferase
MLSNPESEILKWDSNYFGYGVASIIEDKCTYQKLIKILHDLKSKNIRLVYWASDPDDSVSQEAAKKAGGFLADRKTVFLKTLWDFDENCPDSRNIITEYTKNEVNDDLIQLGIAGGEFSRFKRDSNISTAQFEGLYKLWIINSVNKKAADIIHVSYLGEKITGLVISKQKGDRGIASLLAVDKIMRGKNLGTDLIKKSLSWSKKQGCSYGSLATQFDNEPACQLYKKLGYTIESIQNLYHFWL